jgi:hypothetical protein
MSEPDYGPLLNALNEKIVQINIRELINSLIYNCLFKELKFSPYCNRKNGSKESSQLGNIVLILFAAPIVLNERLLSWYGYLEQICVKD